MYIKDNITGVVRLYGTDCHDSLEISDDGKYLTYYNLQCGEGSKYGSYSFVTDDKGTLPRDDEDLIKHGAEAFFNIGGFDDIDMVLKDIRAEIKDEARRGMNERYCDGLRRALKLIDRHMKGEQE